MGEEIERLEREGASLDRHGDSRSRPVPDPRVRRSIHNYRPQLSDSRWFSFLRARRNPRCAGLSSPDRPARRRPRLRAHLQHAQARSRRQDAGKAASPRPRARHSARPAAIEIADSDELPRPPAQHLPRTDAPISRAGAKCRRLAQPGGTGPHHSRRERLYRHAPGGAQRRGSRPAGKPRPSSRARWRTTKRSATSSNTSASSWTTTRPTMPRKVTIMTIHAAKGLEFDHVFLPGWEEGVFPSQRALDEGGLASARGGTASRLRRDNPRAAALHHPACRQPPHLRPVDELDPLALHCRAARPARPAGNHAVRRRVAVARQLVRARRSIRRRRTRRPDRSRARAAPVGNVPLRAATIRCPAALPNRRAAPPASPPSRAPTSPSACACSTTSSATARWSTRKATNSRSSSRPAAASA